MRWRLDTHMNKNKFILEIELRLKKIFMASRDGFKVSLSEKHRNEGFLQAGVFMGFISNEELYEKMNNIHVDVFGISIEEKIKEDKLKWKEGGVDYSLYDIPVFIRDK